MPPSRRLSPAQLHNAVYCVSDAYGTIIAELEDNQRRDATTIQALAQNVDAYRKQVVELESKLRAAKEREGNLISFLIDEKHLDAFRDYESRELITPPMTIPAEGDSRESPSEAPNGAA